MKTKNVENKIAQTNKAILLFGDAFLIIHGALKHYLRDKEKELSIEERKLIKTILKTIDKLFYKLKEVYDDENFVKPIMEKLL